MKSPLCFILFLLTIVLVSCSDDLSQEDASWQVSEDAKGATNAELKARCAKGLKEATSEFIPLAQEEGWSRTLEPFETPEALYQSTVTIQPISPDGELRVFTAHRYCATTQGSVMLSQYLPNYIGSYGAHQLMYPPHFEFSSQFTERTVLDCDLKDNYGPSVSWDWTLHSVKVVPGVWHQVFEDGLQYTDESGSISLEAWSLLARPFGSTTEISNRLSGLNLSMFWPRFHTNTSTPGKEDILHLGGLCEESARNQNLYESSPKAFVKQNAGPLRLPKGAVQYMLDYLKENPEGPDPFNL